MANDYAGIDFGTSNSSVAVFENGKPRLVEIEEDQTQVPTAVFYNFETGTRQFGRAALAEYALGTEGRLMRSLKSILGTSLIDETTRIKSRSVSFVEIVGSFLNYLRE